MKESFILPVDVIFTLTTTFLHSPPDSRRSHTKSCLSFAPATRPFLFQLTGPPVFGPDCDLIRWCPHHLPVLPLLLTSDQSSLDEDVVQEDVDDDVMTGVDLTRDSFAAAYDVIGVEREPCFAAPAFGLGFFLGDQLSPLPNAEEVLLDFPDDFHRLWSAVQGSPCLLEEAYLNGALV